MEDKRNTGRTSRMLEEARRQVRKGRAVYVLCATLSHAQHLANDPDNEFIKFETSQSLANFDWSTMIMRGAHPNCLVFVDHWAIESRYRAVLEMLHRWDS